MFLKFQDENLHIFFIQNTEFKGLAALEVRWRFQKQAAFFFEFPVRDYAGKLGLLGISSKMLPTWPDRKRIHITIRNKLT